MTNLGTAQLEHRGVRAVQHLVEHAPGSGALALWADHRDLTEGQAPPEDDSSGARGTSGEEPSAAAAVTTDGRTLFYAPAFAALPLREQAGDRKSTRLNSSHIQKSRMPSSA